MKKIIILGISVFCSIVIVNGQSHMDALKFSQTFPNGTARNIGMGGAFGSLGGDFSALSINPAGIGVYRSSEFVLSGGYLNSISESDYLHNKVRKPDNLYTLNNIGYVGVFKSGSEEGWVSTSLGLGYNRTNNFFYSADIEGYDYTSMVDYFFANSIDGDGYPLDPINLHPYYEGLAFDTYVIDADTVFDNEGFYIADYISDVPGEVNKRNTMNMKGRTGEFLINFGANYSNKVYIGGALTISSLVYEYSNSHTENDLGNLSDYFDYFKYYFENQTKGRGISFKFGTIIKPVESLRLGLAIHLPTYYSLTDVYDASMESYIYGKYYKKDPTDYKEDPIYGTPLGKNTYEYKLTTPSKYVVSLGYQIQKIGLISVDVERVNYDNMRFKEGGDGYDYYEDNKIITDIYRATTNLRAGAEVRVGPLSFRGGFNYYQSPFESDEINKNANYMAVSGGLGYKYQNFFVDLGMYRQIHKETYLMYDYYYGDDYEYPIINTLNTQFIGTIGFRFN